MIVADAHAVSVTNNTLSGGDVGLLVANGPPASTGLLISGNTIVGEGMIEEVLVPKCIPFRTDY